MNIALLTIILLNIRLNGIVVCSIMWILPVGTSRVDDGGGGGTARRSPRRYRLFMKKNEIILAQLIFDVFKFSKAVLMHI